MMPKVIESAPGPIRTAFEALQREYSPDIEIRLINGSYCVYERITIRDPDTGIRARKSRYIGRINQSGFFIPARHKYQSRMQLRLGAEHPNRFRSQETAPGQNDKENSIVEPKLDEKEMFILQALSMNSRISQQYLGKLLGWSQPKARYSILSLEKKLGIKYTLEIDVEKLGYVYYIVNAKFLGKRPQFDEIKAAIEAEPMVQFAALTKGDYDLFMYILVENNIDKAKEMLYNLRSSVLPNYDMEWKVILFYKTYGYVPLRQEFFEKMLQQKVYKRTKDSPKKGSGTVWKREYDVLRLMNENSSISFAEMDSELGLGGEASRYTYMRLLEQGIIKRPTINITKPPMMKYEAIFQVAKHNQTDWSRRKDILRNIIGESGTVNKYSFVGDIKDIEGVLYISPVFNDGDSSRLSQDIVESTGSDAVRTSIISEVVAGSIGVRRFDNYYSNQNRILMEYGEKSLYPKIDYKLTK